MTHTLRVYCHVGVELEGIHHGTCHIRSPPVPTRAISVSTPYQHVVSVCDAHGFEYDLDRNPTFGTRNENTGNAPSRGILPRPPYQRHAPDDTSRLGRRDVTEPTAPAPAGTDSAARTAASVRVGWAVRWTCPPGWAVRRAWLGASSSRSERVVARQTANGGQRTCGGEASGGLKPAGG